MTSYRDFVAEVAARMDPEEVIFNRNEGHASIIFEHIFVVAQSEVKIVTSELAPVVYGNADVMANVERFLRRDNRYMLSVLHEKHISPEHPLLSHLRLAGLDRQIRLRRVPASVEKKYPYHFAVAKDRNGYSFRFEEDKTKYEAAVQFGSNRGEILWGIFDELWHASASNGDGN